MERKLIKILFVEDHPLISEGYVRALEVLKKQRPELDFKISEAASCDAAIHLLQQQASPGFDLIMLDLVIPPSNCGRWLSGEDIGREVRQRHPETKLLINTSFDSVYRINSIFKTLNPEGYLIKVESNAKVIIDAISRLIDGETFYGGSVLQVLRKNLANDFVLDQWDRQILYQLSLGATTASLSSVLPMSKATIERRKRHLKEIFDVDGQDDQRLLERARELGYI